MRDIYVSLYANEYLKIHVEGKQNDNNKRPQG